MTKLIVDSCEDESLRPLAEGVQKEAMGRPGSPTDWACWERFSCSELLVGFFLDFDPLVRNVSISIRSLSLSSLLWTVHTCSAHGGTTRGFSCDILCGAGRPIMWRQGADQRTGSLCADANIHE